MIVEDEELAYLKEFKGERIEEWTYLFMRNSIKGIGSWAMDLVFALNESDWHEMMNKFKVIRHVIVQCEKQIKEGVEMIKAEWDEYDDDGD